MNILPTTNESYGINFVLRKLRFGQTVLIIHSHKSKLSYIQKDESADDLEELRNMHEELAPWDL